MQDEQLPHMRDEDELLSKRANERLDKIKQEDLISWDEAKRLAGWKGIKTS